MSTTANQQTGSPSGNRFIINLFGESGMGKTTILRQLIEMLRSRAQYNLEVGEGFQTHDLRSMMWYRTGWKYSGAVCVCTMGDSVDIIKKNIDFFNTHFDSSKNLFPWISWVEAFRRGDSPLATSELNSTKMPSSAIGILVTASRKPIVKSDKKLKDRLQGFNILNIPIQLDIWPKLEEEGKIGIWRASVRSPSELVLVHVNYLLRNAKFKPIPKKVFDFKLLSAGISRD